jgi:hypothetical protein
MGRLARFFRQQENHIGLTRGDIDNMTKEKE